MTTATDDGFEEWLDDFATPVAVPSDFDLNDRDTASDMIASAGAIRWEDLTGERRIDTWQKLREFVHWWAARYSIPKNQLPDCWFQHPAIVEELTALKSARQASFSDQDQGLGPIGWHERMALLRARLETHYKGECQNGHIGARARETDKDHEWETWLEQQQ